MEHTKKRQIIYSFRNFYQAICPVREKFEDLSEAIEYIESKEPPNLEAQPVKKMADLFKIDPEYIISIQYKIYEKCWQIV